MGNYSNSYNLYSSDVWYADSPLMDGLGALDESGDVIEQDSKVTSSTEVSPWKPHLPLPPVSELLNTAHGSLRGWRESISPMSDETSPLNAQLKITDRCKQVTVASTNIKAVKTQTPWKLKKNKSASDAKGQKQRKGNPRKIVDKFTYIKQKMMQKEREKAIRDALQKLSEILPCKDLRNGHPSRKEILETAIT
ncbi:uncharacterized protein LOC111329268 [Stylophora pistillata]|uniref:uncharacterized protein LOC111329268 n=1 Tax=Stylophora pistillata TaxID=50429 RepID=UPI000C052253|nr:uncharacterized protein LOC111329268 [Stylophora pistillata]